MLLFIFGTIFKCFIRVNVIFVWTLLDSYNFNYVAMKRLFYIGLHGVSSKLGSWTQLACSINLNLLCSVTEKGSELKCRRNLLHACRNIAVSEIKTYLKT